MGKLGNDRVLAMTLQTQYDMAVRNQSQFAMPTIVANARASAPA
jgi:hypothetical protein